MKHNDILSPEISVSPKKWLERVLSIHSQLVLALEWSDTKVDLSESLRELEHLIDITVDSQAKDLPLDLRQQLKRDVTAETVGLGPIENLFTDPKISDILVNNFDEVYIEKEGRLIRTPIEFADNGHLIRIIQRVVGKVGRRIDESSPMVDARLEDGSRVHAVVPPLALKGPTLSIRRFGNRPLGIDDLLAHGSLSEEIVQFLVAAVKARVSFLISGGTGAGKTTLLNAISSFIPNRERIVTIEDAGELRLQHPHVVSLEARPANSEGKGQISIRNLVRNSLRMRPDRILVGEVRGAEVVDMLQAMNTGHPGSMSTIHANDTKDALSRLEVMVGMSGYEFPIDVLRNYIAAGIQFLVHVARLDGGVRRVTRIVEIIGIKNGNYRLREVFGFRQTGLNDDSCAVGEFYATSYVPRFLRNPQSKRRKIGSVADMSRTQQNPSGSSVCQDNSRPLVVAEESPIEIAPGKRIQLSVQSWSISASNAIDEEPHDEIETMVSSNSTSVVKDNASGGTDPMDKNPSGSMSDEHGAIPIRILPNQSIVVALDSAAMQIHPPAIETPLPSTTQASSPHKVDSPSTNQIGDIDAGDRSANVDLEASGQPSPNFSHYANRIDLAWSSLISENDSESPTKGSSATGGAR